MRTVTAIYQGLPGVKTTHLESKGLPACIYIYNKNVFKSWRWEYGESEQITCPDCKQLTQTKEVALVTTTSIYYTLPVPHKSIKDALHSYDLTFTEVGIFILFIDSSKPLDIDDLRLFSPTDGVAVLQPAVDELVRLGFLVRQES